MNDSIPQPVLRVARPANDLDLVERMYRVGLDLEVLARFKDHDGFDGVVLGVKGGAYHFEFTRCRHHPILPESNPEDLLVLYLPERSDWTDRCRAMASAGFRTVESFNPYWDESGQTFIDPYGYRIVIQQQLW